MKRLLIFLFVVATIPMVSAQLPNRVKKLEGLWEYREGSGFERWTMKDDVMYGESFRINKLGDTLVAERFEISYVNKRLVLNLTAYHMVEDSLSVREKTLIGKKRKMEFSSVSGIQLETLYFKFGFLSKKRLKLFVYHEGVEDPQKLRLVRRED
jgi:hypothetical protein